GLGEQGIAAADGAIGSEVAVTHQGSDAHAPIGERVNAVVGQVGDIDQHIGLAHAELEMVDEVRSSGEEDSTRLLAQERDSAGGVARAFVAKRIHGCASFPTCCICCSSCACWTVSLIAGTILA